MVTVASGTRRLPRTNSASWCTTASPSSVSRTSSSNASAPSASARSKLSKVFSSAFVGEPRCPTTRVGEASKKFMLAGLSSRYMSRFARERPEGVVRRRRAARPLPEGPFAVPLSTIDWLVSRESPAARYVALRDLLGRPPKDPDLRRAKQGFQREPFVREALALLRPRLRPEVGADGALLHLHHAGDVLLARWEKTLVAIERHEDADLDAALFRAALRVLVRIGWERDARVLEGADALAARALAGRGRPEKDLLLFASLPADARSERVLRAISFLSARLLEAELPAALAPGAPEELLMPGFPCGDETDLAEMLLALASVLPPESR